jgi:hypothetical protein
MVLLAVTVLAKRQVLVWRAFSKNQSVMEACDWRAGDTGNSMKKA